VDNAELFCKPTKTRDENKAPTADDLDNIR